MELRLLSLTQVHIKLKDQRTFSPNDLILTRSFELLGRLKLGAAKRLGLAVDLLPERSSGLGEVSEIEATQL